MRKREKAKELAKRAISDTGVTVTGQRADELMKALVIIERAVTTELTGSSTSEGTEDEKENKLEMWKVMCLRLLQVYKNGGKTKGLRVAPEYLSWSMELLARTSVNTFQEVSKVMRLPHISNVYKKSGSFLVPINGHSHCASKHFNQ